MTKSLRCFLTVSLVVMASVWASAQTDTLHIPYSMSFETSGADSVELSKWVLNSGGAACTDKWVVGTEQKNDGRSALYISCDGHTPEYGTRPNVVYAYRDFYMPAGAYYVSFDWKNIGSPTSRLYVGLGPATSLACNSSASSSVLPSAIQTWCSIISDQTNNYSQRNWTNVRVYKSFGSARVYRLFFAWTNNNADTTISNRLGACIDNLQISSGSCVPPASLDVLADCDSTVVTWTGTSASYELSYKKSNSAYWQTRSGLKTNAIIGGSAAGQLVLQGLDEGMYDFRVRGICGTDTSVYTYSSQVVLFCPSQHCINYVGLSDDPNVHCTYNQENYNDGNYSRADILPFQRQGQVDFGPQEKDSRHTVIWDTEATDPRTGNKLRCVPDDELASVRLGNWEANYQCEAITYDYLVDSAFSILLLKYAVVLENPSGHGAQNMPRFRLRIIDQSGVLVDPSCGVKDFNPKDGGKWNKASGWVWKDWTTMGLDLTPYIGQTLKIQVITYDCTWGADAGYAYFTLGCAKAKVEGLSCGDDNQMTVQAPDGFVYAWSPISNLDNIVCTERTFSTAASDTTTYRCRLSYIGETGCYFDLYSSVVPRFPVAEFAYEYAPEDCENKVVFTNRSHIMVKYEGDSVNGTHHYDETCDDFLWVLPNGNKFTSSNLVYTFPQEGGLFPITLLTSISEGRCSDDTTILIKLPAIGPSSLTDSMKLCQGDTYQFGDQLISQSGTYTNTFTTAAGCDSLVNLKVTVAPKHQIFLPDTTICADEVLVIGTDTFPYAYTRQWKRTMQNMYGCDSIVAMYVTVKDSILPVVNVTEIIEDGDLGAFYFSGTGYDYYTVNGVRYDVDSLTNLTPNTYNIIFYNDFGCDSAMVFNLQPGCLGGVVFQRWNDVLSIKNADYTGGRTFATYQWLKDGVAIEGATASYLYEGNGLDFNASYEVLLTDSAGNEYTTCVFHPVKLVDDVTVAPNKVQKGGVVTVESPESAPLSCFNASGLKMFSAEVIDGTTVVKMPSTAGFYILSVQTSKGNKAFRICVTE